MHVVRDLRNKQARAEKMEAKTGKYIAPRVSFKELKLLFRNLSDTTIRYRLRDKCECMPSKVNKTKPACKVKAVIACTYPMAICLAIIV